MNVSTTSLLEHLKWRLVWQNARINVTLMHIIIWANQKTKSFMYCWQSTQKSCNVWCNILHHIFLSNWHSTPPHFSEQLTFYSTTFFWAIDILLHHIFLSNWHSTPPYFSEQLTFYFTIFFRATDILLHYIFPSNWHSTPPYFSEQLTFYFPTFFEQ